MIFQSIMDLFFAGTESTSTTLMWLFLFLVRDVNMQERCRTEIHDVTGGSRRVTLKDRSQLPYVEAVISETLRIASAGRLKAPYYSINTSILYQIYC